MSDEPSQTTENRVHHTRYDIEGLIAMGMGLAPGDDYEVEWSDDHSAVIVIPMRQESADEQS